jgi:NADPH-dependent glutamate synthase beta subunit-like oxidoreductase
MKSFTHRNARSIDEAARLLKKYKGKAKVNAGGTDLLNVLKQEFLPAYPEVVVNIKGIEGLSYIREDGGGLRIGAATPLAEIAASPVVNEGYRLLAECAQSVATPSVRNMATIGGNMAQDVRCWYYRYPFHLGGPIVCLRKGGKTCNALYGDHRYHSVFGAAGMGARPCASGCPSGTDIPAYLEHVKSGRLDDAARVLADYNPMPAVTGRVCPTFCEPECNRGAFDAPVAIRCVERSVGDYMLEHADRIFTPPQAASGKRVAVVGSGPAGLAAAFYLRRSGHGVTVFERQPEAGGMLLYAIPPYRLPKDIVKKQIAALEMMGIEFRTGVAAGEGMALSDLAGRFSAVFVAAGAWRQRPMGIKGERLALSGLSFLGRINTGERDLPGRNVAVIGGGNVAIDVARTLRRLGAHPVIVYRRSRAEMPALKEEVRKGREEGVRFRFLTLPKEASKKGSAIRLTCSRAKLGAPDASGRRRPVEIPGSEFDVTFDGVIKAVGEEPDFALLPAGMGTKARQKGGGRARLLGGNVFAGGDFVTGPSTVVEALASGKEAAALIDASLMGKDARPVTRPPVRPAYPAFEATPRLAVPEMAAEERVRSIDAEEAPGVPAKAIAAEAARCFNCGCLAVSPSDIGIALVALDARVVTTQRTIDAQAFFTATATSSTALAPDELITGIIVPKPPAHARQSYTKFTLRTPIDFALVGVGALIDAENGACRDARIVLGALGPSPMRATTAENALKGRKIDAEVAAQAADAALAGARPLTMNGYKVEIANALIREAILKDAK